MNRDIRDEILVFLEFFFVDWRFVAFLNQNFILISKTTRDWDRVAFGSLSRYLLKIAV
jgi:hypothetical protein